MNKQNICKTEICTDEYTFDNSSREKLIWFTIAKTYHLCEHKFLAHKIYTILLETIKHNVRNQWFEIK